MNLTADLKEKARQLLGGKNVTKKRLEALLEEVEQARVVKTKPMESVEQPSVLLIHPGSEEKVKELLAAPISTPLDTAGEVQSGDQKMELLMATIAQMQAKIEDLQKPKGEEDQKLAIAAGKIPVGKPQPGPVGYTGSAQLPIGVWFESPFGPKVQMKLCDCRECTPTRFAHYFCVVCQQGPFAYTQGLGGKRDHFAPGSTWGVSHVSCSPSCWTQYDRSTARRAVARAPEARPEVHPMLAGEDVGPVPERPLLGATSD